MSKNSSKLPNSLIPMIRRTFPELLASDSTGVQPMSGPIGLAFNLDYKKSDPVLEKHRQDIKEWLLGND